MVWCDTNDRMIGRDSFYSNVRSNINGWIVILEWMISFDALVDSSHLFFLFGFVPITLMLTALNISSGWEASRVPD